jgi:hypothetical protein
MKILLFSQTEDREEGELHQISLCFTQVFNGIYETTIPITTMHKYMHQLNGIMRNSYIKPILTRQHRIDRLNIISMLPQVFM